MTAWVCATCGPVPAGAIRHLDHNSPHGHETHECGSSAGLDWTTDRTPIRERNTDVSETKLRRRVQDTDGVVFTEHPTGRWVMEDDPDSYRRLIDTWDSYEQLLGDAVELTELEPAPAYTADELDEATA